MSLVDQSRSETDDAPDDELGSRRWPHPATWVALAIGLGALGWHSWVIVRGYFWQDDFALIEKAATTSLTPNYLLAPHNGNVMPAQNLFIWLVTKVAPMNWLAAVIPLLALHGIALVLLWRLLTLIFGARPALLIPFTMVALSPLVLMANSWWAQALETVPLLVTMLGALNAQVRYVRTGESVHAVNAVAWTVAGLLCWDKAVLIPIVLFGVTALLAPYRAEGTVVGWAARRFWRQWVAFVVLLGLYAAAYLTITAGTVGGERPSATSLVELAQRMLAQSFLPGLFGGPWHAATLLPQSWSVTSVPVLAATWAVTGLIVVAALVLRRARAAWAWTLLVVYLLALVGLVAVARMAVLGSLIGGDPRYVADAVPVAALCLAFAFLRPLGDEAPRRGVDRATTRVLVLVGAAATIVFVIGTTVTVDRYGDQLAHREARHYVANLEQALAENPNIVLYDTGVPPEIMLEWFGPEATASTVLGQLPSKPRFSRSAEDLRMVSAEGVPQPIELVEAAPAQPGPVPSCGFEVTRLPSIIPLTGQVRGNRLVVRMEYFSSREVLANVQAGPTSLDVKFLTGVHFLYLVVDGPVQQVRLWHNQADLTVCVTGMVVGKPLPRR